MVLFWYKKDGVERLYGLNKLIFPFPPDPKDPVISSGEDVPFDTSFGRRAGFSSEIKS